MKTCVEEMHGAGLHYPIIIGGSPVNEKFAKEISILEDTSVYKGGVFYAKDAFMGLKVIQALMNPAEKEKAMDEYLKKVEKWPEGRTTEKAELAPTTVHKLKREEDVPVPPFYGARAISRIPADEVFNYLNEKMLFDVAWSAGKAKDEKQSLIDEEYRPLLKELEEESLRKRWLDFKAVYGYFKCRVKGEELEILTEKGKVLETIRFERVKEATGGALTDYFLPGPDGYDIVAFQTVTVGEKIGSAIASLIDKKDILQKPWQHIYMTAFARN
jgi:5-methyltetrahydrofolate--homocysteine methyltransferase